MGEFICLVVGMAIGGLFGVTLMCCLQINRLNEVARRQEDEYEKEKCR